MGNCKAECTAEKCVVSCVGVRYAPGSKVLRLCKDSLDKLKKAVMKPKEVGGVIEPDLEDGVLRVLEMNGGDRDSVEIPIGVFQFHTHPNSCKSRSACYFDFPSENDMALISRDSMRGVIAHYVISRERVYRVALGADLRRKFARDAYAVDAVFPHFETFMNQLQERALKEGIHILPALLQEWIHEAVKYGFTVHVYTSPEDIVEKIETI